MPVDAVRDDLRRPLKQSGRAFILVSLAPFGHKFVLPIVVSHKFPDGPTSPIEVRNQMFGAVLIANLMSRHCAPIGGSCLGPPTFALPRFEATL
jgi:hypothetical protein